MEQYENDKKEISRKYRQQLKETNKQMNTLNNHIMDTQIKFKTVNNKIDQSERNIKNDFKEHKNEIKEEIKEINNKMDKLKEDVKNDFKEHKNEIKEEIENNVIEIQKYMKTELESADKLISKIEKQSKKQKQKFDNYKQQTNKRFNKIEQQMEQQMDKLNRDNSSLLDMLKCLIFRKNDSKKNITFEDKQDYAANDSVNNNFDLNRSFTSMNLRRTDSCFFSINANDDDNRNSNNSFTVFNRKSDIVPNLEEKDIKENNK
jgi:DNA repair exonuclease SbcCD ATPase subunit